MSKFKNIGIAEAGVVPDLSGVFGRMVAGFQNISSQRQQSTNNLLRVFGEIKARSKKRAGIVESKANQVMAATDDTGLDLIIADKAQFINQPIQEASFVEQSQVNSTIERLDNLDVMKDNIIRLKTKLVDFKKTASYENMSEEAIANLELLLDNDFEIGDVTQRKIIIGGSEIDLNNLNKQYVARDAIGVRNTQIVINRYVDPKNAQFNSIAFNQDMSVIMDNRDDMGAKLMVSDLSIGGAGTIKDQLVENIESFTDLLNSSGIDLNNDGTPDGEQVTQENAMEFIKILTTPGDDNYDEATTNSFVKNLLENQVNITYLDNKEELKVSDPVFSIENFFDNTTTTAATLGNITRLTQNLSKGDLAEASRYARQLGYVIRGVGNDGTIDDKLRAGAPTYQIFERKVDMREEIDDGEGGKMQNPDLRRPKAGEAVSNKFTLNDQKALLKNFQILVTEAQGYGFSRKDFNTYMRFLSKPENQNFLFRNPVIDFSFNENKNK